MRNRLFGAAVGICLAWPTAAYAFTPVHIQSSSWWDSLMSDAVDQAAMWIGDMGAVPTYIIGAGLLLIVISGIVALVKS